MSSTPSASFHRSPAQYGPVDSPGAGFSRRRFIAGLGAVAAGAVLPACSSGPQRIDSSSPQVAAADRLRPRSGRVVPFTFAAMPVTVDLAGRRARTWAYGPTLAGPEIRVRRGDTIDLSLDNQLPEGTTIHWHGINIDNAQDGVPGVTQRAVGPGSSHRYRFVVPDAGTYWYHSHVGLQLDRGLYGPLVVEDPDDEPVDLDQVIVLDDWLDGLGGTPERTLNVLKSSMTGMGSMGGGGPTSGSGGGSMAGMAGAGAVASNAAAAPPPAMTSKLLGGDAGDVDYPLHLLNGRPPADRPTYRVAAGGKVRLRLINAGSDTAYRFAVGGHRLTVTHADGRPVQPVDVDAVLVGMGERYDVSFTVETGVWPVHAQAEGKRGWASALLRTTGTAGTEAPPPDARPGQLEGTVLTYRQLTPAGPAVLSARRPDRSYEVLLTGTMAGYRWGLAGDAHRLQVRWGERVRVTMRNSTRMWHPMHLHGHGFALSGLGGARKDTVNVLPGQTVSIDFDADNPGQWMYHCHNTYHLATGMATTVSYIS